MKMPNLTNINTVFRILFTNKVIVIYAIIMIYFLCDKGWVSQMSLG